MNAQVNEPAYYAVANIASGRVVKTTPTLVVAATALVPETCWGSGSTREEALFDAMAEAALFRMRR